MFLLLLVGFALFFVTDGISQVALIDRVEDQLRAGVEPGDVAIAGRGGADAPLAGGEQTFWAALEDGAIVGSSGNPFREVIDAPLADLTFGPEVDGDDGLFDLAGVKKVDGLEWFVVERDVTLGDDRALRLIAATDGVYSFGAFFWSSLLVTVPVVLVLMAVAMAVTSYFTRRALRRVERMRAEVELITQESLDRRVPLVDAADGIDKLAITMNTMLERLEHSSAQQNQFLADASHELRSPVAGLLAQLEVAAAYPDRVDASALLPKLHREAERLQSLVNDLLFLSRSEAGEPIAASPEATQGLSVDEMIDTEVTHQSLLTSDIAVRVGERSDAAVVGNRRDIERAIRNLVDNAVRHASNVVRVGASVDGDDVVISVVDDGPGVAAADADRIFDRFVRLDEARSRDVGGSGLGLAIARQIARKHRGDVTLADSSGGAHFELRLPAS